MNKNKMNQLNDFEKLINKFGSELFQKFKQDCDEQLANNGGNSSIEYRKIEIKTTTVAKNSLNKREVDGVNSVEEKHSSTHVSEIDLTVNSITTEITSSRQNYSKNIRNVDEHGGKLG